MEDLNLLWPEARYVADIYRRRSPSGRVPAHIQKHLDELDRARKARPASTPRRDAHDPGE